MDPRTHKAYIALCQTAFSTQQAINNLRPYKAFKVYARYAFTQAALKAPRVSHLDTFTPAYTPSRLNLSPYIVYGSIFTFLAWEFSRIRSARQAQRIRLLEDLKQQNH
eukprot:TRINITY_DN921_c0_g1_i3.p3 TRINITY_DN921_c0_g1~~TRINITY_DN921_c0_g1_i3.p3  ORF type:complete len:108 (+),score=20.90 TRINITY_DN921_c0_g1_i3:70-393(+)